MYRSDVLGAPLRPNYFKKAREDFAAGRPVDAKFKLRIVV
jgi:hypothetical protein